MKSIVLTVVLGVSTICYSAHDATTSPNHIIGVASATDNNYATRRGFIDEGKTYACAIAHTPDSSISKEILQQIAHEIFQQQITSELFSIPLPINPKKIKLPAQYTLNLISLIITKEKLRHTAAQQRRYSTGYSTGYAACLPDTTVYDVQDKTQQTFQTKNGNFLIKTAHPGGPIFALNRDKVAKQIANSNAKLGEELIVITDTLPLLCHDVCAIS